MTVSTYRADIVIEVSAHDAIEAQQQMDDLLNGACRDRLGIEDYWTESIEHQADHDRECDCTFCFECECDDCSPDEPVEPVTLRDGSLCVCEVCKPVDDPDVPILNVPGLLGSVLGKR